jgi:hypothetical protein
MNHEPDYRLICDQARVVYVGRRGDSVLFRDPETDAVLQLYASALTPANIFLTCKAAREKIAETAEWEPVTQNERG